MSFLETLQIAFTILGPVVGFIGIMMVGAKLEKRSESLLQELPEEIWSVIDPLRRFKVTIHLVGICILLLTGLSRSSHYSLFNWTAWLMVGWGILVVCYEMFCVARVAKTRRRFTVEGSDSVSRGLCYLGLGRGLTATALLLVGIVYAYVVAWKGIEGNGGAF